MLSVAVSKISQGILPWEILYTQMISDHLRLVNIQIRSDYVIRPLPRLTLTDLG